MTGGTFDVLILVARPAAGKSEIIDYLRNTEPRERRQRFRLGELAVIDDFPMLWAWFEEDALLEQMGKPRLHTDEEGYFREPYLWDLLVRRICLEHAKLLRERPAFHETGTAVLEFSRGSEHGGYRQAFAALSREVVERAAVLYVQVSYQESLRKNLRRFDPHRPHGILEHSLPQEKMERLYRLDDWQELCPPQAQSLAVQGRRVPCAVFENEDDLTTPGGEALGERLERSLQELWRQATVG